MNDNLIANGKILKGIGGFYYIETADAVYECKARGVFRKQKITPLVGDNVTVTIRSNGENTIDSILPRKNFLVRPPVANIEQIFILSAACNPSPNFYLIDKMTALAVNKGIASTRNIGLDNITGDYIGWVDADDWVDTNMFGELANLLSTTNSEIAYCHYFIEGTHTEACIVGNLLSSDKECVLYNYFLKTDLHSLCNKLFRKSLFVDNNIRFLEGCNFCEDLNVTAKLIYCAKKIYFTRYG